MSGHLPSQDACQPGVMQQLRSNLCWQLTVSTCSPSEPAVGSSSTASRPAVLKGAFLPGYQQCSHEVLHGSSPATRPPALGAACAAPGGPPGALAGAGPCSAPAEMLQQSVLPAGQPVRQHVGVFKWIHKQSKEKQSSTAKPLMPASGPTATCKDVQCILSGPAVAGRGTCCKCFCPFGHNNYKQR